jgi:hypothetical protein
MIIYKGLEPQAFSWIALSKILPLIQTFIYYQVKTAADSEKFEWSSTDEIDYLCLQYVLIILKN